MHYYKPNLQLYACNTALFDPIKIAIETFSANDNFTHKWKATSFLFILMSFILIHKSTPERKTRNEIAIVHILRYPSRPNPQLWKQLLLNIEFDIIAFIYYISTNYGHSVLKKNLFECISFVNFEPLLRIWLTTSAFGAII